MAISTKKYRQYKLIVLLRTEKPVLKEILFKEMDCSEATFTRDLRELREEFQAIIKFHKASKKYQLVSKGTLTPKQLRYMRDVLISREQSGISVITSGGVNLDKEGKKNVSLSLSLAVIRKIDSHANATGLNRSQVVEWLVDEILPPRSLAAKQVLPSD
ncbi:tellurium resistance protein TerW [Rosenbergiella collisarenosi]|uniref:tellurium resistance protein TerW n=1 Tax=Rosenbergiella collisarenosi TaxID=1544695 RepID=UPI001F4DDDF0|nr:tellurium resistance protein TerW [Rosenbergiella collisarenosi]